MSKNAEIKALIYLLDDDDETVIKAVTERLLTYGDEIVFNLEQSWESTVNVVVQERIESIIHQINFIEISKKLKYWLLDDFPDLYTGAEIVAKYHFADLDTESLKTSIEGIKQKIWLELNNDLTPLETVSVFNHVFYGQLNFSGHKVEALNISDYCLNHLIETKKASPITVGILYIILAQDLNIPIYGVNLTNHFILSYQKKFIVDFSKDNIDASMFYIDPINKGTVFGRQDITKYLKVIGKEKDSVYYKPACHKAVIKSLLVYMLGFFERTKQLQNATEIHSLIALFD